MTSRHRFKAFLHAIPTAWDTLLHLWHPHKNSHLLTEGSSRSPLLREPEALHKLPLLLLGEMHPTSLGACSSFRARTGSQHP